jgi:hypothetical protein
MTFDTVGDYISDARTLLQDRIVPYRYSTISLIAALNLALLEVRRIRPDLLWDNLDNVPNYDWNDAMSTLVPGTDGNADDDDNPTWTQWVPIEQQFRTAVVYGIGAHALARDQEDIQDEAANDFRTTFENMLTEVRGSKGKTPPRGP